MLKLYNAFLQCTKRLDFDARTKTTSRSCRKGLSSHRQKQHQQSILYSYGSEKLPGYELRTQPMDLYRSMLKEKCIFLRSSFLHDFFRIFITDGFNVRDCASIMIV